MRYEALESNKIQIIRIGENEFLNNIQKEQ